MADKKNKLDSILLISDWTAAIERIGLLLKKEPYSLQVERLGSIPANFAFNRFDLIIVAVPTKALGAEARRLIELKQGADLIPFFVISDEANWSIPVELIKFGINEYLVFPLNKHQCRDLIQHHIKLYKLTHKVFMNEEVEHLTVPFEGMIGRSPAMQENMRMITAVAKSNATVLITGESGTGKELVAKAVHRRSTRKNHRFVDLNCGAIPKDLLENELFGHEKGAFTGAHKRYQGSFEVADHGTLFLDEISEMDPLLQVKLLRVLQERSFMRIGGTERIAVDVRIIAATNKDLHATIEKGLFREDLFYRLNVVNINIPALRERREDIPLLARHFLEFYSAKNNRIFLDFSNDAIEALINYDWPGNVRELENTIERIVVLYNDSQVKMKFLPKHIQSVSRDISYAELSKESLDESRVVPLEELERRAIEMAMLKFQGNVAIVAKKLRIGQATLYRKVKRYGLSK